MAEHDNLPPENDFLILPILSHNDSDERQHEGSNSLESIGPLYDLLDDDDRRGALSQGECSLPTGHETPSDESAGNRSHCGSNDAVAEEPPEEFELIDLDYQYDLAMVQVPDEIHLTAEEQMRVERDLERAAEGGDLSDKLTGDSSGGSQERFNEFEKPTLRPTALRFDDRCTTPTRSRQGGLPKSPSSPNSQRTDWTATRSEVYRFTYETANPHPRSPVPQYVFVHPGGLARVTVIHTDQGAHTSDEFIPEYIPDQRERSRNEGLLSQICLYTLLAILFLALVTLGAGLAKARELNRIDQDNESFGDVAAWLTPMPTPVSWMTNNPTQSTIVEETKPTPDFVIPVDGAPSSSGGIPPSLLKEGETTEPVGDPPTRPPREQRTRAPSAAPTESTMPPGLLKEGETDSPVGDPRTRPPREQRTDAPSEAPSESSYPSSVPSDGPTQPPLTISQEHAMRHIKAIISYESPASIPFLSDPTETSPHFKALRWLAEEDMVLEKYSNSKIIQRWVLAAFYFSTISDERSWSNSTGWLQYTDECTWYSKDSRGMCNSEGEVRILDLQHNGLAGTVLPEISLLSNSLTRLYLRGNDVGGTLPTELGKLLNLEFLQLTWNDIHGSIPTEIGSLANLVVLGLGRNHLSDILPHELGKLGKLDTLGLEANSFRGNIPLEWTGMSQLRLLALDNNELSGHVDSSLGSLAKLEKLTLHENDLKGYIPSEVCALRTKALFRLTVDCDKVYCTCCDRCSQN